ncbi:2'-5' RNA ligase [Brevibacillus sp. AG162]|uniref:RNA 2',3'-cyclic phosphodiesterase n=1 Tax=Brevibacillus sp. AG162 TaxID=2572910 RepID=UPI0011503700|nr:RNA 2',3'-cyclic phosphodiesterase [Brevibacillus sp. AG162]TQK74491.1 2'-5' RNA ligase [Brevibacillus sp. AG162]
MRLFIALDIPVEAAAYIADVQKRLKQDVTADRWQSLANLHLTLHFLGEVQESLVPAICEDMDIVSAIIQPFTLRVGNFGVFPNALHPRVLWLGLRGQLSPLEQLHLLLGRRFELREGLSYDRKRYRPHITLARGPHRSGDELALLDWNERYLAQEPPQWKARHFHLYRSELLPEGAVHTIIHTSTFDKDHSKKQALPE